MIKIKANLLIIAVIILQLTTLNGQSISNSEKGFQEGNPKIHQESATKSIQPYIQNQWYWQYLGEPIILKGGSDDDNLFQWTDKKLTDQLDLLVSVGGNYLRNTMSDRDSGNVYAFRMDKNNKYDLNQWNEEYWNRLTFFLDETTKRGIIVQLTLWDHFDISSSRRWKVHPWNPEKNMSMKPGAWENRRDFYASVTKNDQEALKYQRKFIDKLLSISLKYDNILYNINNESSGAGEWENFWAVYIKEVAENVSKKIFVTNMQLSPSNAVRHVMTYHNIFDFVDISQNNQDSKGGRGQGHWDNLMYFREKIASFGPMPMNNEKVYGSVDGRNNSAGSETEAMDRFWRNIFAGCASSRFHRPAMPRAWGSGLNERVQTNLKAMDMLLEKLDIVACSPHNDLLSPNVAVPSTMEAYTTANIGHQYAVYFPQGRYSINLDPWVYVSKVKLQWLDINNLKWSEPEIIDVKWEGSSHDWGYRGIISLETPENRQCVAFIEVVE